MARRLANKGRRSAPKTTELGTKQYSSYEEKIQAYRKYIEQEDYLEYAIDKIAVELTHFLMK
ncbi:MAG: hypothetical protein D6767_01145 [Candidatus Hydrogenedentota bacterium]|nr:MAG: hypothetical protein D6767_01145 [Candidatus Hydrogenedentota bacterium]